MTVQRRNGGIGIELAVPLKWQGKDIDTLDIRPMTLEHVIRWGRGDIVSTMALLSELTDIPELVLRNMTYPDVDRVLVAFVSIMPMPIRNDFEQGKRALATDREELEVQGNAPLVPDPVDPRFPAALGPVTRIKPDAEGEEDKGMSISSPPVAKAS